MSLARSLPIEVAPVTPEAPGPARFIHAGQIVVSDQPVTFTTILGSCVAVCLLDSRAGVGGINHFVLPESRSQHEEPGRFGNPSVSMLIEQMLKAGASTRSMTAKVFGGSSLMAGVETARRIGEANIQAALEELDRHRIGVVSKDTSGCRGRKLIFRVPDGWAAVRYL